MKKVTVLFSAIVLIAALAGTYAAKSQVDDVVYLCNIQNVCDSAMTATLIPHGASIGRFQAATVRVSCSDPLCTTKDVYPAF